MLRIAACGVAFLATAAAAQYRDGQPGMAGEGGERPGQPMTLDAPVRVDQDAITRDRFAARYRQARSPRMVVFWNREFTDEVESDYEQYTRAESRTDVDVSGRRRSYYDYGSAVTDTNAGGSATSSVEIRSGRERVNDGRRGSLVSQAEDQDIEIAFTGALQSAGVRLADRASLMRRQGRGVRSSDPNVQTIETDAVLGNADLVLEVTQVPDARRTDGISYRVLVRDVSAGTVVGSITTSGRPPKRVMPYVAGSSGFVRAVQPEPDASDIGRQIAIETMAMLSRKF
jgi:hypothetical protein